MLSGSLQLQQPLEHGALFRCFLLLERKELAVSDTTLLQKFSFGSIEHLLLKGKKTLQGLCEHSKLYCAERRCGVMVRLSPSEVYSQLSHNIFISDLCAFNAFAEGIFFFLLILREKNNLTFI